MMTITYIVVHIFVGVIYVQLYICNVIVYIWWSNIGVNIMFA